MSTNRLYYTDSQLTSFDASVVDTGAVDGRPFAVLDRTAFYPTTGGQPHDIGTLGPRRVVDVVDREDDGAVVHVLDGPLDGVVSVRGVIDWARRLDHMQQHTGQHMLSAAFIRCCDLRTVSFHLGADVSTIDLAGTPDAAAVARAEDEANRVVWEDRAVTVRFVSAEEAAALPLRKEPVRGGTLRLVEVQDFDLSACGGTHVARTGTVGTIAVQAWERYKGGTRVSFVCGNRVVAQFRAYRDLVSAAVRQLSIQPSELPESIGRLQKDARDLRLQGKALAERVAVYEAEEYSRSAEIRGSVAVVCRILDRDANALKSLAQAIVQRPGHAVVLIGERRPSVVVTARSADVTVDAARILESLIEQFGGKGGGRPEGAQGGGLDADASEILAAASSALGA